jgi:D-cysteine desulfhydrase
VWVKRDDESSARYGGSKVRKLEWILANPPYGAPGQGACEGPPILTLGAFGSHHLLALALFLPPPRELHALVCDQPATQHALDDLAALASQRVRFWSVATRAELPIAFARHARDVALGRVPKAVFMGPGASTPLGGFGYVEAGLELAEQVRGGIMPRPDRIYVTGGTAGASAGLYVGLALAGLHTRLHVVSAVEVIGFNRWRFESVVRSIWAELWRHGLTETRPLAQVRDAAGVELVIDHRQVGQGGRRRGQARADVGSRPRHHVHRQVSRRAPARSRRRRDVEIAARRKAQRDLAILEHPRCDRRAPVHHAGLASAATGTSAAHRRGRAVSGDAVPRKARMHGRLTG